MGRAGITAATTATTFAELPPPSQAWAANEMLNILEACVPEMGAGTDAGPLGPRSRILASAGGGEEARLCGPLPLQRRSEFRPRCRSIGCCPSLMRPALCGKSIPTRASPTGRPRTDNANGDTIVLSTADGEGNMVAWVNSNYSGFGSGITVPGYGFILHNRGALFSLDPKSPNAIAPHKRPFNTLSAGFVMRGQQPLMSVPLMGGDMQAQGHAQVLVNILDLGANLQAAADLTIRTPQIPNVLSLESSSSCKRRAETHRDGPQGPARSTGPTSAAFR